MSRRTGLAVAWSVLILVACSIPGSELPDSALLSHDKVGHFALFFGFGWLWLRVAPGRVGTVLAAGIGYAIGSEAWQAALPLNRSGDVYDVVADVAGLLAGLAVRVWQTRGRSGAASGPGNDPARRVS